MFAICAALGLFCGLPESEARSPADCANAAAAPAGAVQVRRAIATCSRALERDALDDEQRAEMLRLRGNASRLAGAFERSIADLTAAKQLRPGNPLVARGLALALSAAGKAPEAEREIERALLLEPSLPGFLIRCMIYTEAGRPADGITDCEAVHQVDPSEESAFLAARAYAKLGRVRDAVSVLESAIATRNGSPRVRNLLAETRGLKPQRPATNASRR